MFHLVTLFSGFFVIEIASITVSLKTSLPPHPSTRMSRLTYEPCRNKAPGKFVKDLYSCDKFYYCGADGLAINVDCPHSMIFNDEKEICDFSDNYLCVPLEEEEISTVTFAAETTLEEQSTSNMISFSTMATPTTTSAPDTKRLCPLNDAEDLVFVPDEYECHRYYICYHGMPIAQQCISELHWNSKANRCDFPKNAGCSLHTEEYPTAAVPDLNIISCPFRGEQIFPHPDHCNYFIYCINGYATVQQCPFYHFYDVRTKSCRWQTLTKCRVRKIVDLK